jgi:hypothetical protein
MQVGLMEKSRDQTLKCSEKGKDESKEHLGY